jgi:broad specificity phosphatase PhoE
MTTLIIVRHGHTALNDGDRFRGRTDTPLDEQGLREAEVTAKAIAGRWKLSAVYTSSVSRAHVTGEIIGKPFDLPAVDEPGILDMDYGEWTGLTFEEAEAHSPEVYKICMERPSAFKPPKGESFEELRERSVAAVKSIAQRHPNQAVAIVTHNVVNRVILLGFLETTTDLFWRMHQGTCAINVLEYDGKGYGIELINDTSHIRNMKG